MAAKTLILLALLFLLVSVFFGIQSYTFVNNSVKTEARVMRFDNGKGRMVTPVFEYSVKGKYYEYKGASTRAGNYKINDKEIIYYDPSNPEDGKLGTFMNLWFISVFCGGFFIVLFSVGLGMFFSGKANPHFHKGIS